MSKVEIKYQIPGFALILVSLFLIIQFIKPFIKDFQFNNRVQKAINYDKEGFSGGPPEVYEVTERMEYFIIKLKLPMTKKDFKVTKFEGGLEVSYKYTYKVNLYITKVPWKFEGVLRTE